MGLQYERQRLYNAFAGCATIKIVSPGEFIKIVSRGMV
jgi:hypothetical protein